MHGNCHMIGNVTTATVRCCWKRLWMGTAFAAPVTERPTGSMWDRPPGAAVWIGSTRLTVRQSKISTPIRWCVTHGSSYAAILCGKQIHCHLAPEKEPRPHFPSESGTYSHAHDQRRGP